MEKKKMYGKPPASEQEAWVERVLDGLNHSPMDEEEKGVTLERVLRRIGKHIYRSIPDDATDEDMDKVITPQMDNLLWMIFDYTVVPQTEPGHEAEEALNRLFERSPVMKKEFADFIKKTKEVKKNKNALVC